MGIHAKLESYFERFGHFVYRHKWLVFAGMLVIAVGFISQMSKLTVDMSNEGLLHESDPIRVTYDKFREKFGREEVIVLVIDTPNLFSPQSLERLRDLHYDLKEHTPHLADITSLINARNTRGEGDSLIVEELFKNWPNSDAKIEAIKKLALNNEIYRDLLLSEDGTLSAIILKPVTFVDGKDGTDITAGFQDSATDGLRGKAAPQPKYLGEKENAELVAAVKEIVAKHQKSDFKIVEGGTPIVIDQLQNAMQHDMPKFTMYSLLIIILVLAVMFRRISGVMFPIVVVVVTLLSTFGMMAIVGTAMKMPTQILPSMVLAISIASSVYVLSIFYRKFNESYDKEASIASALGHSGLSIVMASVTTAVGLLSFSASDLAPIADLGIFAGVSVLLSLVYTVIFLPALIAIFPIFRKTRRPDAKTGGLVDELLGWVANITTTHSVKIIIFFGILFVVSAISIVNLQFRHDPLEWMPESWDTVKATRLLDARLNGSTTTEIVINTNKENGLYEPTVMHKLDEIQKDLVSHKYSNDMARVGKAYSVVDIVKESNRALRGNRPEWFKVPDGRELIAQELLLFENSGSDDLKDFVDSQFKEARISLKTPWIDAGTSSQFLQEIGGLVNEKFKGVAEVSVTGMGPLFVRTLNSAIFSLRDSYIITIVVITILMTLLFWDLKLGIVSMVPNILPITMVLGGMALLGVPLDLFTMLVGTIAIGLAVDDTIHFMHTCRRDYRETGDIKAAIGRTMKSTGRAMIVSSVVLAAGFFVFMAATMKNVVIFGAITGSAILLALVADLILSPALLMVAYRNKPVGGGNER